MIKMKKMKNRTHSGDWSTERRGKSKKLFLLAVLGAGFTVFPVSAFSPSFVAGSSAENTFTSTTVDGTGTHEIWLDLYGLGSWRTTFEKGGYAALNGNVVFEKDVSDGTAAAENIQDKEYIEGTLGLPAPGGRVVLKAGNSSSINDLDYGTSIRPTWSGEYTYSPGSRRDVQPFIGYSGYYLYQEQGSDDRAAHTASLGLSYDPSIKRGYRLETSATLELWEKDYSEYLEGLEAYTIKTDGTRRDVLIDAEAEINGLAGYFADWAVTIDGGARLSNDDELLTEEEKKDLGNSSLFGGLEGSFSWSPARSLRLSSLLYSDIRRYSDRTTDPAENASTDSLYEVNAGGNIDLDWTPNDRVYFTLGLSGGRTFYNTGYGSWNFGVSGGVEMGF
ncbi:MAG: hypothetical protein ACLFSA_11210 [Spirochaetaceae bacterium]